VKTSPKTSASAARPAAGEHLRRDLDQGLVSHFLGEARTTKGKRTGHSSSIFSTGAQHFVAQHRADTDFADEPHLDWGATIRDA
jgi:hypothetical protein